MPLDTIDQVQTFLPYRSFASSARVLDDKRLGKQRVETLQIMKAHSLGGGEGLHRGWSAHPAARMWVGHLDLLMIYQEATVAEWVKRGFRDTCLDKTFDFFKAIPKSAHDPEPPRWLGKKVIHSVHRANLLRKDFDYYKRYRWPEEPREGYWWPILKDGGSGFIVVKPRKVKA